MSFFVELKDADEVIYVTAAIGRIQNPLNVQLYERLLENLLPSEQHRVTVLSNEMEFSPNAARR